jgi:hypothetical protein
VQPPPGHVILELDEAARLAQTCRSLLDVHARQRVGLAPDVPALPMLHAEQLRASINWLERTHSVSAQDFDAVAAWSEAYLPRRPWMGE